MIVFIPPMSSLADFQYCSLCIMSQSNRCNICTFVGLLHLALQLVVVESSASKDDHDHEDCLGEVYGLLSFIMRSYESFTTGIGQKWEKVGNQKKKEIQKSRKAEKKEIRENRKSKKVGNQKKVGIWEKQEIRKSRETKKKIKKEGNLKL